MIKRLPIIAFALLLGQALVLRAASPEVSDGGGFFTAAAVHDADGVIQQIKQKHNRDLMVETFAEIPTDRRSQYSADQKDQFFDQWTLDRGRELKLTGVYVLICRDPSHLQVRVGNDTVKRAFTVADRERLRDILLENFRNKQYDQALAKGVAFVQQTIDRNMSSDNGPAAPSVNSLPPVAAPPAPRPLNMPPAGNSSVFGGIPMILIVIVGAIVVMSLLRRIFGSGQSGGNVGYGRPPGMFGGFGGGLLGGLLSGYLTNRWNNSSGQSNWNTPPSTGGGGGIFDNTSGSSGGDFGSSSSSNSSSSSGGDFGGSSGSSSGGGSSGGDF
jgi:uncharacterized membrane protein YgcG